MHYIFF